MILRQYLHTEPTVAASYLIGCGGKRAACVVDPVEDFAPYLEDSRRHGMSIRYVIDTHVHADHVSGARRLASETQAEYVLGAAAEARFPFLGVRDGDCLELGNVQLGFLDTPGHTPEHISVLIVDRTRGDEPWCVATGHTLMVGDMGRTELAARAEEGAGMLFESAGKLWSLPDHLLVLPGAYSGSVCGRGLSGMPSSTIGFEKMFNPAFRIRELSRFVEYMLRNIPSRPPEAERIRALNLGRDPD